MGIDVVTLALAKGYTDEKIRDAAFGDVPLDTSLTKNGQAADAKAVGDRIQSLSKEISDRIIAPTTAAVGQTIVVKAVDDEGVPTAWEPVDFPESTNDSDALEALAECGIITPVYQDETFYTDANGAIYTL